MSRSRSLTLPCSWAAGRTAFLISVLGAVGYNSAGAQQNAMPACTLSSENHRLIQEALHGWERVSRDFLQLDATSLPWTVLFDTSCVWHLAPREELVPDGAPVVTGLTFAGRPVPVRAQRHDGTVHLPHGGQVPARGMAFGSLREDDETPFFVLALLDVWRLDTQAAQDPQLADIILGVVSHEIVHTLQLVAVARRVEELRDHYELPEALNDDVVEERFRDVPGYGAAYRAESDLLYEAVAEPDAERRRSLVTMALSMARERRDRYFTGRDEVYRQLEDLFLNMEGVAVWSAFKLAQADADGGADTQTRGFERERNTWSQDEGLALFLLIEQMVPGWRARVLGPELASPFTLLEEVVGEIRPQGLE